MVFPVAVCLHVYYYHPLIVAFHTNGVLKSSVQWGTEWIAKFGPLEEGLYVLGIQQIPFSPSIVDKIMFLLCEDVYYCSLDVKDCPEYSHCRRLGAGNYSCVCEPGLIMSTVEFAGRKSCLPVDVQTSTPFSFSNEEFCAEEEECDIPDE